MAGKCLDKELIMVNLAKTLVQLFDLGKRIDNFHFTFGVKPLLLDPLHVVLVSQLFLLLEQYFGLLHISEGVVVAASP